MDRNTAHIWASLGTTPEFRAATPTIIEGYTSRNVVFSMVVQHRETGVYYKIMWERTDKEIGYVGEILELRFEKVAPQYTITGYVPCGYH